MSFLNGCVVTFIGVITGYIYGLLFVAGKQRALFATYSKTKKLLFIFGASILRFALLGGFLIYLLRSPLLVSILALASFLVTFWLNIIRKGLMHHEGRITT